MVELNGGSGKRSKAILWRAAAEIYRKAAEK